MGALWDHWRGDDARRLVERSVAAFNARDFGTLRELLTDDYTLIDSMGEAVTGREAVFVLLKRLFACDPHFRIHVESMTTHKDAVLLTGSTTGSHRLSSQRTLSRMVVRDGRVAEWRSYSADNPQPFISLLTGEQNRTDLPNNLVVRP